MDLTFEQYIKKLEEELDSFEENSVQYEYQLKRIRDTKAKIAYAREIARAEVLAGLLDSSQKVHFENIEKFFTEEEIKLAKKFLSNKKGET